MRRRTLLKSLLRQIFHLSQFLVVNFAEFALGDVNAAHGLHETVFIKRLLVVDAFDDLKSTLSYLHTLCHKSNAAKSY